MNSKQQSKSFSIYSLCAALLVAFLSLVGCAPVRPWEKQFLAKPIMAFDTDPLEAKAMQHIYFSKEASQGGYGVGGGGCGCN